MDAQCMSVAAESTGLSQQVGGVHAEESTVPCSLVMHMIDS